MAQALTSVIESFGYAILLICVLIQSTGIPFPGAMVLVGLAAYASATDQMSIVALLVTASVAGIVGSLGGFWAGNRLGYRLLLDYGHYIGLTEHRLKVSRYLTDRFGRRAVFGGRVFAPWMIPLVGVTAAGWRLVVPGLVAGSIAWALLFGLGGYFFGSNFKLLQGPLGVLVAAVILLLVIRFFVVVGRTMKEYEVAAEKAYPGPLLEKDISAGAPTA
jgi:membrane protein DedA with SNARE-associated domain